MIDLSGLIDDYLARQERRRELGRIWVSDVPWCMRRTWYEYHMPKPYPSEKLRLFRSADLAHGFVRDVLAASDKVKLLRWERDLSIYLGDFSLDGRYDDLIWAKFGDQGEPVLIEVKTVGGRAVGHIGSPRREHLYQILPYMHASRTRVGIMLYLARDTFADRWFTVSYDAGMMEQVIERARELHGYLARRELPPPEAKQGGQNFLCRYCLWDQECGMDLEVETG